MTGGGGGQLGPEVTSRSYYGELPFPYGQPPGGGGSQTIPVPPTPYYGGGGGGGGGVGSSQGFTFAPPPSLQSAPPPSLSTTPTGQFGLHSQHVAAPYLPHPPSVPPMGSAQSTGQPTSGVGAGPINVPLSLSLPPPPHPSHHPTMTSSTTGSTVQPPIGRYYGDLRTEQHEAFYQPFIAQPLLSRDLKRPFYINNIMQPQEPLL